jgi:hypothetical protein
MTELYCNNLQQLEESAKEGKKEKDEKDISQASRARHSIVSSTKVKQPRAHSQSQPAYVVTTHISTPSKRCK